MSETEILIYIGDELYGRRRWPDVPRIGESVMLYGEKSGQYQVKEIIWAGESENPQAHIEVEPPKDKP